MKSGNHMASVKLSFVVFPLVFVYLVSVAGFGKYSCHCDHSREVSFLGITSQCGCTHDHQGCDVVHSCVCGGELITEKTDNDDCCEVTYNKLTDDQTITDSQMNAPQEDVSLVHAQPPLFSFYLVAQTPVIKNFHALFRRYSGTDVLGITSQLRL
jgi:hypothetical protein